MAVGVLMSEEQDTEKRRVRVVDGVPGTVPGECGGCQIRRMFG